MNRTFYVPAGSQERAAQASAEAQAYLRRLPTTHAWEVVIREHKAKRTTDQNALLWALYGDILEKGGAILAGWEADDLHELFLIEHFGSTTLKGMGRKRLKPLRRSSKMSKVEFADHVEFIVRYMALKGVYLELPGDLP